MVIVAVDDLLFSSKIRSAATRAGVELIVVRTLPEILQQARVARPSLAIFDLDAERLDPIETIRALKSDPELSGITALGFVSHVHAPRIAAARKAGADEVMARSAFLARLNEILQANRDPRTSNAPGTGNLAS